MRELARKIKQCLDESGIQASVDFSSHDAVVYGKIETEGKFLKVIAHITDREILPPSYGTVDRATVKDRLETAVIRPSLSTINPKFAVQTATDPMPEQNYSNPNEIC